MDARSTIAAMAAGVALGGDPTPFTHNVDRSAWEASLAAHCEAMRALEEAPDDQWDTVSDSHSYATTGLILTPAPDAAALLFKLEYLFGPEAGWSACYCEEWMRAVMADAHRLLTVGRA